MFAGSALAHKGVMNSSVKARMNAMSAIAEQMKTLGKMAKGVTPFDSATARLAAAEIAKHAGDTPKLFEPGYKFSASGCYYSFDFDPDDVHASYMGYIKTLPINPEPEAFGMHENANITCAENEVTQRFMTIVTMQSSAGGSGGGKSREELIGDAAKSIEDGLPLLFDEEATGMKFPVTYLESMNTLLCQEQLKYNKLLRVLKRTLYQVQRALKGLDVMSTELDGVATSIFNQWIPNVSLES